MLSTIVAATTLSTVFSSAPTAGVANKCHSGHSTKIGHEIYCLPSISQDKHVDRVEPFQCAPDWHLQHSGPLIWCCPDDETTGITSRCRYIGLDRSGSSNNLVATSDSQDPAMNLVAFEGCPPKFTPVPSDDNQDWCCSDEEGLCFRPSGLSGTRRDLTTVEDSQDSHVLPESPEKCSPGCGYCVNGKCVYMDKSSDAAKDLTARKDSQGTHRNLVRPQACPPGYDPYMFPDGNRYWCCQDYVPCIDMGKTTEALLDLVTWDADHEAGMDFTGPITCPSGSRLERRGTRVWCCRQGRCIYMGNDSNAVLDIVARDDLQRIDTELDTNKKCPPGYKISQCGAFKCCCNDDKCLQRLDQAEALMEAFTPENGQGASTELATGNECPPGHIIEQCLLGLCCCNDRGCHLKVDGAYPEVAAFAPANSQDAEVEINTVNRRQGFEVCEEDDDGLWCCDEDDDCHYKDEDEGAVNASNSQLALKDSQRPPLDPELPRGPAECRAYLHSLDGPPATKLQMDSFAVTLCNDNETFFTVKSNDHYSRTHICCCDRWAEQQCHFSRQWPISSRRGLDTSKADKDASMELDLTGEDYSPAIRMDLDGKKECKKDENATPWRGNIRCCPRDGKGECRWILGTGGSTSRRSLDTVEAEEGAPTDLSLADDEYCHGDDVPTDWLGGILCCPEDLSLSCYDSPKTPPQPRDLTASEENRETDLDLNSRSDCDSDESLEMIHGYPECCRQGWKCRPYPGPWSNHRDLAASEDSQVTDMHLAMSKKKCKSHEVLMISGDHKVCCPKKGGKCRRHHLSARTLREITALSDSQEDQTDLATANSDHCPANWSSHWNDTKTICCPGSFEKETFFHCCVGSNRDPHGQYPPKYSPPCFDWVNVNRSDYDTRIEEDVAIMRESSDWQCWFNSTCEPTHEFDDDDDEDVARSASHPPKDNVNGGVGGPEASEMVDIDGEEASLAKESETELAEKAGTGPSCHWPMC